MLNLNVILMISDFCIGGTVKCDDHRVCHNEVVVGNKRNLLQNVDIAGKKIYNECTVHCALTKSSDLVDFTAASTT